LPPAPDHLVVNPPEAASPAVEGRVLEKEDGMKLKLAVCAFGLFAASSAFADGWPASVAGNWSVRGNQSPGVLALAQFAGLPGSQCKPIRGVIYGVDRVEGFYCPGSGRISFLRYVGGSSSPMQHWSGNLSQVVAGQRLYIGGLFATFVHNNVFGTVGGSLGEYNFQAVK
jgi:hypothetical protein